MKVVDDIMVKDLIILNQSDSIYQARMLMKEKNIRHLPVIDSDTGDYLGVVSQARLLNYTFKIIEKFGLASFEKREQRTSVNEIMSKDSPVVAPGTGLREVSDMFLADKLSCLLVVDGSKLKGIVSSVDFVKLARQFLDD